MPLLNIDPWVCASPSSESHFDANSLTSFVFLTLYGVLLGLGLTSLVQSTLTIQARKALIHAAHFCGGIVWTLAVVTCGAPWTFPLIVAQTYLYGSEPYDNALSPRFCAVIESSGKRIDRYWAISSIVMHAWFMEAQR